MKAALGACPGCIGCYRAGPQQMDLAGLGEPRNHGTQFSRRTAADTLQPGAVRGDGNEPALQAPNQSIVSPDRPAGTLQLAADHACAARVLIGEGQRGERRRKHREALGIRWRCCGLI